MSGLPTPHVYRLAPSMAARLMGPALVLLALLVLGLTALVAATGLPPDLLVVGIALGLAAVLTLGWWLRTRAWVLRVDEPQGRHPHHAAGPDAGRGPRGLRPRDAAPPRRRAEAQAALLSARPAPWPRGEGDSAPAHRSL